MGLPPRLLGQGEHEVLHLHTHWKTMIGPGLVLLLAGTLTGVALAFVPADWQPWAGFVIALVAVVALVIGFVVPLLTWRTTTYTLTNRRMITRRGIISKAGHDLPLQRISNVSYEQDLLDRILRCGTLVFTTSAEAPLVLSDIPGIEAVHVQVSNLLFANGGPRE
ncbi:MAG: PH domain-containing protein [Micropruina sp.]|nr:PH domain-containing protein [Micropruina sp.]